MSNSLDPEQVPYVIVEPDLGPNYLKEESNLIWIQTAFDDTRS